MTVIGTKQAVYNGLADKTSGGVTKDGITYTNGRYKFINKMNAAKNSGNSWFDAVKKAKNELNIGKKGQPAVMINKGADGIRLYKKALAIYKNL